MTLSIILMGVIVGFLVGMTGVGGASLLTPILILIGIHPSIAVGTDLLYNSITKLFGTIQHWRQKTIDFKLVKMLALGSLPGVVLAVVFLKLFDSFFDNQEVIIKHALGYVLILVAFATMFKVFFGHRLKENRLAAKILGGETLVDDYDWCSSRLHRWAHVYWLRFLICHCHALLFPNDSCSARWYDIAHAFLLASTAGILHASMGNVNYTLVINLLIGSIPGVLIGSMLATKAPTTVLRTIIATLVLISGLKLI